MSDFLYFILHIDHYLITFVAQYGLWSYLVLFAVIFCETGLVVTPFLPGDSLLFAVGSLAAQRQSPLNAAILFLLLALASILGNQVNYWIGRFLGPKVFTAKDSWFFNKKHLVRAHEFYERNGGKTIILARFLPIIRTFAPFVAGVSYMGHHKFFVYNVLSALLWIGGLLGSGYYFGSIPVIRDNFSMVVYGIIVLSCLPPIVVFLSNKR
jgi:membrane-associated protein